MDEVRGPPDPEELEIARSHLDFPVIGIGASAGGISALQRLFEKMPAQTGMAFVVVMHLSPDHESSLGPILQRSCALRIVTVAATQPIHADHVYVISPSMKLAMSDGQLQVARLLDPVSRQRSIDLFFRSLAEAHRERAVCVVLSGTGADGAQGVKRVKELGGVTIAQSPDDAEFDGMPRAAMHTEQIDFSLRSEEIAGKLVELWDNARRIELPDPPSDLKVEHVAGDAEHLAEEALLSIKALLRERTGHDFARYKRATVLRRLERRMQVAALPDLPSYRRYLESEPRETQALLQDMLISVTNFFRDPEAFEALRQRVRAAAAERAPSEPFRAWIAGCATGEEAFSVAILLREILQPLGTPVQIFASDIDARAIAHARAGVYPTSIATDVSLERLREQFVADPGGYRISKSVRDGIVFSVHNVLSDAPFTRMDLVCCRNLLIYVDRTAQAQLLRSFHFALKPGGLLFLGGSETADAAESVFTDVDKRYRIYQANTTAKRSLALPALTVLPIAPILSAETNPVPPAGPVFVRTPMEALHARVLLRLAPATVLVDADDTTLHVTNAPRTCCACLAARPPTS